MECGSTLNRVPNQKETTVSLFSWAQIYSTDMINGTISVYKENKTKYY